MTDPTNPIYSARLDELIALLKQAGCDAFVQPVNDEFQGEYTPDYAKRLEWITGFSGSAGMGVFLAEPIGGKKAVLFVDGRYTLQAANEVNQSEYMILNSAEHKPADWLDEYVQKLAFDPWLHTQQQIDLWEKRKFELAICDTNPIDEVWKDQPAPPAEPIELHSLKYAGETSESKCQRLCVKLKDNNADAVLLTLPDGINWLLNIRGTDIPFNPLVLSYALVTKDGYITLFIHKRDHALPEIHGAQIEDIADIKKTLKAIRKSHPVIQIDPSVSASALFDMCDDAGLGVINKSDPTLMMKACKNPVEIDGMRQAHQRDGRALSEFLEWFEKTKEKTEMGCVQVLDGFRREHGGELYQGKSFETISGSGPNGAIVHYRVSEESNRTIEKNDLYLVDSGAQYLDGTTDVTRTIINGKPTDEMIDRFTRVLKGHIAIATAVFPEGTSGGQLDILARQKLWDIGCDYDHGTGHGVGSYLCVHEGPQRISKRGCDVPLKEGMILSNEPGYYKDGEYGIRIENLVLVVEVDKTEKGKKLLGFETLTLAPIDTRLIDSKALTKKEKKWLDEYHQRVSENNKA